MRRRSRLPWSGLPKLLETGAPPARRRGRVTAMRAEEKGGRPLLRTSEPAVLNAEGSREEAGRPRRGVGRGTSLESVGGRLHWILWPPLREGHPQRRGRRGMIRLLPTRFRHPTDETLHNRVNASTAAAVHFGSENTLHRSKDSEKRKRGVSRPQPLKRPVHPTSLELPIFRSRRFNPCGGRRCQGRLPERPAS